MKSDFIIIVILLFLIYSCTGNKVQPNQAKIVSDSTITSKLYESKDNVEDGNLDSIKQVILKESKISKDTLRYHFSIEDIGTEGNEGTAYYVNNQLRKVEFDIYTSMWKIRLLYLLNKDDIKVIEETFNIHENIKQVRKLSYLINLEGVPIEKVDSNRVDVFQYIKDIIPFKLK